MPAIRTTYYDVLISVTHARERGVCQGFKAKGDTMSIWHGLESRCSNSMVGVIGCCVIQPDFKMSVTSNNQFTICSECLETETCQTGYVQ